MSVMTAVLRGAGRYSLVGSGKTVSLRALVSERFGNNLILQTGHQAFFVVKNWTISSFRFGRKFFLS